MTEKKKLKQRVRTRMSLTGERYTEALTHVQEDKKLEEAAFEDALQGFLHCQTPEQVRGAARNFHQRHFGNTPGWEALASHALEVLLPRRVSWATGKDTCRPEDRSPSAASDLRELLTQYKTGGVLPGMGDAVERNFKKPSGWLGSVPKEELVEKFAGVEVDDEFEFDPPGSPPRYYPLTPDEQAVFDGIWKEEPNVDAAYGLAVPKAKVLEQNLANNMAVQGVLSVDVANAVAKSLSKEHCNEDRKKQAINLVLRLTKDQDSDDSISSFIGESIPWVAPIATAVLSNARAIIEQEGRKIVAYVCSSRDFADVRLFPPGDFGVEWEKGVDGERHVTYFDTPIWHTHEIEANHLYAVSDDDRLVECKITR